MSSSSSSPAAAASTAAEPRKSSISFASSSSKVAAEEQVRTMLTRPAGSLIEPSKKRRSRQPPRLLRLIRALFRTLPIFTPRCKPCRVPAAPGGLPESSRRSLTGTRVTGTLFGYRKGRVNFCVQENPKCLPTLIVELAMQTHVLLRDMGTGMVRIALECEKRPHHHQHKDRPSASSKLLDEPIWTMFANGKKSGYGVRRDASEEDLLVMELLRAVSMGAGVLPGRSDAEGPDGEMAYVRAGFEQVVGSRDSETFYMLSPEGNNGPDLTIFFVRL